MKKRLTKNLLSGAAVAVLAIGLAACEPSDERALEHLESGLQLMEGGDPERALLEFREATRLNPELAPAYVAIGRVRESEGNMQDAVGHYTRAVEVDETNTEARIRLGRIMLAAGQLDEALRHSMSAAQLAPDNVEALNLRASVGVQVENFDLARESANAALAIAPNDANAHVVLAALDHRAGDLKAAEARIDDAIATNPNHLALNLFKIRLLEQGKRQEEVLPVLRRLADAYPDRPQFRSAMVRWHLSRDEVELAEQAVRDYADSRPDDSAAALSLVQFILRQRGAEAARAELEKMLGDAETDEKRFPFASALVRMDLSEGNLDEAAKRLQDLIATYGDSTNGDTARVQLAAIRFGKGDHDAARELVEKVLSHDARNARALAVRAQLKLKEDRYDAAIQDIRLAIAEDPNNWRYLMLEAQAHELNGSQSLVGERLAAAAQASDYAPTPVLAYARHLKAVDKNDFAEGLVENALRKKPDNPALLRALAQIKLDLKDWVGAEEIAGRLRNLKGGERLADFVDAQSLAGQENREASIKLLEGLYEKGESSQTSMAALVSSYLRSNQEDRARDFLDDVLREQPDNLSAIKLKGDLQFALKEIDEAEKTFLGLVEKAPNEAAAHNALVQFYVRQQRNEEAQKAAQIGVEKTGNTRLKLSVAMLQEAAGDYAGAVETYRELYESSSTSFVVANNLASILVDRFPTPENLELAHTVAKRLRSSNVPQYQDTYGWTLYMRGDPEQALRFLQPAAERMPNIMLAQFHLGMAYAKAGVNDRAITTLEKAIELATDAEAKQAAEAKKTLEELKAKAANNN